MLPARILLVVSLLSVGVSGAGDEYERVLAVATRLQREIRPGEGADRPLERAYVKLAEAYKLDPRRWEAPAMRGTNRCEMAVVCRRILARRLNELRARGASRKEFEQVHRRGLDYIDRRIEEGIQNFQVMERRLFDAHQKDPDIVRFANAAIKYARGEYLSAKGGAPGAIDDFKALVKRGWRPKHCAEFVARCYLEVGAAVYVQEKYEEAQEYWDEALRWAQERSTKRRILTNKAGAFESTSEYDLATKVLREQIKREPGRPSHWKHLGLLLGAEGNLREALDAYARARELCRKAKTPFFLGLLHGSAWLKAAMIHGKLLEEDGDLLVAWRLFLAYRGMFGDDYNFCLNLGDFAFHMGQYDLARVFLERARDLQPFCHVPYLLLLQLAPRTSGTREEVAKRVREAKVAAERARARSRIAEGSPSLQRLCHGLSDLSEGGSIGKKTPLLKPDPLAGFDLDHLPDWIVKAAERRKPFRPFDADIDRRIESDLKPPARPSPEPQERPFPWAAALSLAAACVAGTALWRRRIRRKTA